MTTNTHASDDQSLLDDIGFRFDTRYTSLPSVFHHAGTPGPAPAPKTMVVNDALAESLGLRLAGLPPDTLAALFSGQRLPAGATPFSQAYAGHQFGGFTNLGDGRAHLLGEHLGPDGRRVDIQFKGSGHTTYSRGGDGRATLGPMLREYVISEAMAGLGIPTTRSLAVVLTGSRVMREQVLPGAVLTRVAASHIRIGTFQFARAVNDVDNLRALLDYTIDRHYPEVADAPHPALALWDAVARRQAALIISWMRVGFVHGVMNTDNSTLSGETIDYGPCAFMDRYSGSTVFSSIDRNGRYAYGNQPRIIRWNLARFVETLLPFIDADEDKAIAIAEERLDRLGEQMNEAWIDMMRDKLGLPGQHDDDLSLSTRLLELMESTSADYTDTFRALSGATELPEALKSAPGWDAWRTRWDTRCDRAPGAPPSGDATRRMRTSNPAVIARNHLVEDALGAAVQSGDMAPFNRLVAALQSPYEERPGLAPFQEPPPESFCNYTTFCGT